MNISKKIAKGLDKVSCLFDILSYRIYKEPTKKYNTPNKIYWDNITPSITIKDGQYYNLQISEDVGEEIEPGLWERVAVFLFTPNRKKHEHYHIDLDIEEAKALRNWLNDFIETPNESGLMK